MLENLLRRLDRAALSRPARAGGAALGQALDLLLPTSCAVCEEPDTRLCRPCRRALARCLHFPPLPAELLTSIELPGGQVSVTACAAGQYTNELARAILSFKNRQRLFLCGQLCAPLAALVNAACAAHDAGGRIWLVPVPSSAAARARRGYWPVRELIKGARRAGLLDQRLACRPVLRSRLAGSLGGTQKGKGARQRRERNTTLYAFAARRSGQRVLLVDDVLTTGATLAAAAAACQAAGYQVIGAVVLALTSPPSREDRQ